MVEAGGRLRLAQDAPRVGARDLLHRDLALEALVEGPIDGAHAPRADPVEDPEASHDELTHHSGSSFAADGPDPPGARKASCVCSHPAAGLPRQGSYSARVERTVSAFNARAGGLSLAFLDEEEALAPRGGGEPPFRRVRDHQRQIMVRRAIGVGVLVLLLILIVLGIRGCLNARKERSFENYASRPERDRRPDEAALRRLLRPAQRPRQPQPAELRGPDRFADRGSAESLAQPGRGARHPGRAEGRPERARARLRRCARDALTGISDQISTALGDRGQRTRP